MSVTLAGKVVAITGATRGLGLAVARACAAAGAELVVNGRDAARLDALVAELPSAVGVPGSVAEEDVADRVAEAAIERFGRLDVLINNAGIVRDRTTLRMTAEEFDDVVAVNLRGTWLCGRAAARAMRQTGGQIVNVVSNVAFHGSVGQSNYAATKAAGAALTRAWAHELERYGIRSNAVWPVAMTDMTQVVVERDGRSAAEIGLGEPDAVAAVFVFLASDAAAHLNAQVLTFNGGRLAVWKKPREVEIRHRDHWTADDVAAAFDGPDGFAEQRMYEPALRPLA
jgi:3-oxoacyl-[acyl-carrier protein] reductase